MKKILLSILLLLLLLPVCLSPNILPEVKADSTALPKFSITGSLNYTAAFDILEMVNEERAAVGSAPLEMDQTLLDAAMQRAAEISVYYSHTRPDGSPWSTAFPSFYSGENIAIGYTSSQAVMNGWMNSQGHRENILRSGYTHIGIGAFYQNGCHCWVQIFSGHAIGASVQPFDERVEKTVQITARNDYLSPGVYPAAIDLTVGQSTSLYVYNDNTEFYNQVELDTSGLHFQSGDPSVAVPTNDGTVTATGVGSTAITILASNGTPLLTVPVTVTLAKPSVDTAAISTGIRVTWKKVPGATDYIVYRRTYANGKWSGYVRYKQTSELSYLDKNVKSGSRVAYAVYAYSKNSRSPLGTSQEVVFLSRPVVKAVNAASGVCVSWNKVSGATDYIVYRSTYTNGVWSGYVRQKLTTGLSYTDTSVHSGAAVKYAVYAYQGAHRSALGISPATYYLKQPTVHVENGVTAVRVTWNKVAGATRYRVYRSTYANGTWSDYVLYQTTTSLGYADKNVRSGSRVRYTVYACKGNYKSAHKTGVITRFLTQPSVKLAKAAKGVNISWNRVTGAAGYKIYRSVYKNGKWTAYSLYKSTTACTYTDTSVKAGTKVRYTVYAFNGKTMSTYKTGVIFTR